MPTLVSLSRPANKDGDFPDRAYYQVSLRLVLPPSPMGKGKPLLLSAADSCRPPAETTAAAFPAFECSLWDSCNHGGQARQSLVGGSLLWFQKIVGEGRCTKRRDSTKTTFPNKEMIVPDTQRICTDSLDCPFFDHFVTPAFYLLAQLRVRKKKLSK